MQVDKKNDLYKAALAKWGVAFQCIKTCEEAGELLQAISKVMLGKWPKEKLAEEIVDVQIMTEQLIQAYNISDIVEKKKLSKLKRLAKRLKNG